MPPKNPVRIVEMACVVLPKTRTSWRDQTTSYIRPAAPDRMKMARIGQRRDVTGGPQWSARCSGWLARKDSNLRSPDPESGALPLGHSPVRGRVYRPTAAGLNGRRCAMAARLNGRRARRPFAKPSSGEDGDVEPAGTEDATHHERLGERPRLPSLQCAARVVR